MFGLDLSEFALIGIVALLFIGPKDMPVAIRTVTTLLKKGRKLAGEFQGHVDEMIKEADLGEARDQFRQLRSFNVRGQLMKALDSDGSIQQTFRENPLAPAGPKAAMQRLPSAADPAPHPLLAGGQPSEAMPTSAIAARPIHGRPMTDLQAGLSDEERAALDAADPAPPILPPAVAGRLRVARAKPVAPSFVPPRAAGQLPAAARRPHAHPSADAAS